MHAACLSRIASLANQDNAAGDQYLMSLVARGKMVEGTDVLMSVETGTQGAGLAKYFPGDHRGVRIEHWSQNTEFGNKLSTYGR